jgi:hypothetical protein
MNNEFVTYEQALALKELGFDEPCFGAYISKSISILGTEEYDMSFIPQNSLFNDIDEYDIISAPLKQQAFRWFREKHDLKHEIINDLSNDLINTMYVYSIFYVYNIFLVNRSEEYKTYEEAEQACLDKLIEIIKK